MTNSRAAQAQKSERLVRRWPKLSLWEGGGNLVMGADVRASVLLWMLTRIGNNILLLTPSFQFGGNQRKEKKRGRKQAAGQRSWECVTSSLVISRMAVQFQVHHLPLSATLGPPDTLHLGGASARILMQPPATSDWSHCCHPATGVVISINFAHWLALLSCSRNSRVHTRSSFCLCKRCKYAWITTIKSLSTSQAIIHGH